MHPKPTGAPQQQPETQTRQILVVDDEPVIRDLCSHVLSDFGIFEAADGEKALEVLEQEAIDLVLTDVMMPRLNGLELLEKIKESEPNQAVVMMTGYAEKEIILRALKAHADDFISKPINLLELRTTVDRALEKKQLREELVRLKHMDRLKSEFLGLISHKLRTPVTGISLFLQNLGDGIGDPEDPVFRKNLRLVQEEFQYLEYLIQDLLHHSKAILQDGPPQLQELDLRERVLNQLAELREAAANQGVNLVQAIAPGLPRLQLDRHRIDFVLQALLGNALKFTPAGGTITVDGETDDDAVKLRIRDTGPGIPREELAKVFEKFYQVDPAHTGQVRGFGLGLFYVRQYVEELGGRVSLESDPDSGTTAILRFSRS